VQSLTSLSFSFIFAPPGSEDFIHSIDGLSTISMKQIRQSTNVVYILAESLSGAYAINTEAGRKAMPFFQSLLVANRTEMHLFPKARAASGDTVDCLTSLVTGCLPYSSAGKSIAFSRSIGSEFKRTGYQTASFSSRKLTVKGTKWHMLHDYLTANMDKVYDPISEGHKTVNGEGADDRELVSDSEHWMHVREDSMTSPFYAQFYMFNTHWPFVCGNCSPGELNFDIRYFAALTSLDSALERIFTTLMTFDHLEDTIVVLSGDHGEYKQK
jgi:phosphoglycerol transferase MdoB-like AlkP superfamily enzyme